MYENKRKYFPKSQKGIKQFFKFHKIRSEYLVKARGARRILTRLYGGIGGPRRQKWMIQLKMWKRFGIGKNAN